MQLLTYIFLNNGAAQIALSMAPTTLMVLIVNTINFRQDVQATSKLMTLFVLFYRNVLIIKLWTVLR